MNIRRLFACGAMVLGVWGCQAQGETTSDLSALSGQFSITATGQGTYKLDLPVVPDPALSPKLSLTYTSTEKQRVFGLGWQLQGVSAIQLCRPSRQLNDEWANVSLDQPARYGKNRFCYENMQLVAVQGAYGAPGTEYRTNVFNGTRFFSRGQCGNGPCSFEMQGADGATTYFGTDENALIQPAGPKGDVATWGMSRVTSRNGNTMEITYDRSSGDTTLYLGAIRYASNPAIDRAARREVRFTYRNADYAAVQPRFIGLGGHVFSQTRIIEKITMVLDGKPVNELDFSLTKMANTQAYLLSSLTWCGIAPDDGSRLCSRPSKFTYETSSTSTPDGLPELRRTSSVSMGQVSPKWDEVTAFTMDKYGDGIPGVAIISRAPNGAAQFQFARADRDGVLHRASDKVDLGAWGDKDGNRFVFRQFDKNGDGIDDLIKIYQGNDGRAYAQAYLSRFGQPGFTPEPHPQSLGMNYVATGDGKILFMARDINGDGHADLISMEPELTTPKPYRYRVIGHVSDPHGGFPTQVDINRKLQAYFPLNRDQTFNFKDVTGSHQSDFFLAGPQGGFPDTGSAKGSSSQDGPQFRLLGAALYRQGESLVGPQTQSELINLGSSGDWGTIPAFTWTDFNNDGLSDFVIFRYLEGQRATGEVWINSGQTYASMLQAPGQGANVTQAFEAALSSAEPKELLYSVQFMDADGDGAKDMFKYMAKSGEPTAQDGTYFQVYRNTGKSFEYLGQTRSFGPHSRNILIDLDGNGVGDVISIIQDDGRLRIDGWVNQGVPARAEMIQIDTGLGRTTEITYAKLGSDVYTVDGAHVPNAPYVIINQPLRVVKSYVEQVKLADGSVQSREETDIAYENAIFNTLDWTFSGFSGIKYMDRAAGSVSHYLYHTEYPLAGKIREVQRSSLATGQLWETQKSDFVTLVLNPSAKPQILAVREKTSENYTMYRDPQSGMDAIAYGTIERYHHEPVYGQMIQKSTELYGYPELIYKCMSYVNKQSAKEWMLGRFSGALMTRVPCADTFTGADSHVWNPETDLRMMRLVFDSSPQMNVRSTQSYYYDVKNPKQSGWTGGIRSYTPSGMVAGYEYHSAVQLPDGSYASGDQVSHVRFEYDAYDYPMRTLSDGKMPLINSMEFDPRYGRPIAQQLANGAAMRQDINALGAITDRYTLSQTGVMTHMMQGARYDTGRAYYSETRHRTSWDGDDVSTWPWARSYFNGNATTYREEGQGEEGKILISRNVSYDVATGRTITSDLPRYQGEPVESTHMRYDDRGGVQEVAFDNGYVRKTATEYGSARRTDTMFKPDPRGPQDVQDSAVATVPPLVSTHSTIDYRTRQTTTYDERGGALTAQTDILGQRVQVTQPNGLIERYAFDSLGRLIHRHTPDEGDTYNTYNALNQLVAISRANGSHSALSYDEHRRLIQVRNTASDGTSYDVQYFYGEAREGYENAGTLTAVKTPDALVAFNYYPNGQIAQQIVTIEGNHQYVTGYTYFPDGRFETITYPDQSQVRYRVGLTGSVVGADYIDAAGTKTALASLEDFSPQMRAGTIELGNQIKISRSFDYLNRTTAYQASKMQAQTPFISMDYGYNLSGHVIQRDTSIGTNAAQTERFGYDVAGNLILAQGGDYGDVTYAYDANTNLTQKGELSFTIAKDSNHLVAAQQAGGGLLAYKYDDSGLLLGQTHMSPDGRVLAASCEGAQCLATQAYTYLPNNRLASVNQDTALTQFGYDGYGHRVLKVVTDPATGKQLSKLHVINDGYEVSFDPDGIPTITKHIFIKGENLASLSKIGDGVESVRYHLRDRQSSLRASFDAVTGVVDQQSFDPYGLPALAIATPDTRVEFTGKLLDSSSGLYYFGQRYYDPLSGRFLTPDRAHQFNSPYTYGGGNPLGGTDPNGLIFGIDDLIMAAIILPAVAEAVADVAADAVAAGAADGLVGVIAGAAGAGAVAVEDGAAAAVAEGAVAELVAAAEQSAAAAVDGLTEAANATALEDTVLFQNGSSIDSLIPNGPEDENWEWLRGNLQESRAGEGYDEVLEGFPNQTVHLIVSAEDFLDHDVYVGEGAPLLAADHLQYYEVASDGYLRILVTSPSDQDDITLANDPMWTPLERFNPVRLPRPPSPEGFSDETTTTEYSDYGTLSDSDRSSILGGEARNLDNLPHLLDLGPYPNPILARHAVIDGVNWVYMNDYVWGESHTIDNYIVRQFLMRQEDFINTNFYRVNAQGDISILNEQDLLQIGLRPRR